MSFSVGSVACLIFALAVVHVAGQGEVAAPNGQSDVIPPGFIGPIEPKKTAGIVEVDTPEVGSDTAELTVEEPSEVASVQEEKTEDASADTGADSTTDTGTDSTADAGADSAAETGVDPSTGGTPSFSRDAACDYGSDITEALFKAVMNGDINCAAKILSENDDIWALAKGFRFDPDQRNDILEKSDNRNDDPDVIAMKAIAKSALDTGDATKLAAVMVVSTLDRRDESLEAALREDLSNRELMAAILNADANTEFVPDVGGLSTGLRRVLLTFGKRRLMCDGCTPSDSLVCSHCWAQDICQNFFWCS